MHSLIAGLEVGCCVCHVWVLSSGFNVLQPMLCVCVCVQYIACLIHCTIQTPTISHGQCTEYDESLSAEDKALLRYQKQRTRELTRMGWGCMWGHGVWEDVAFSMLHSIPIQTSKHTYILHDAKHSNTNKYTHPLSQVQAGSTSQRRMTMTMTMVVYRKHSHTWVSLSQLVMMTCL